jgi:hypothetical protein
MQNDPRHDLRALTRLEVPGDLTARLRIIGSREALRRRRLASLPAIAGHVHQEISHLLSNMVRPFAVPFAGGLISSVLLFAMLAPALSIRPLNGIDVPTGLATEASLESSFVLYLTSSTMTEVIVVDVYVDEQGRVLDYSLPQGQSWAKNPLLVRNLENVLLTTKFTPATFFGQPLAGRTRISLRRSQVEVRG